MQTPTEPEGQWPERSAPDGQEAANQLVEVRLEKLARLRERGIEPFAGRYERSHTAREIVEAFPANDGETVRVAGRIMAQRVHGKASFADLRDLSGRIQIYGRVDQLGEQPYHDFTDLDVGDLIGVEGRVFRSRRGEISIEAAHCTLLAKSLRPLPEKWHGLRDVDLRYRQRYVDLIVNPEVRETFAKRSAIVRAMRRFLDERGFMEVETPVLQTLAGGGHARPFRTHHNALDLDLYLRIALELFHKRLIVGGFERVYEFGRVFRNEGISTKHNPEFTMLELYQAYADYSDMMELVEGMYSAVAQEVLGAMVLNYQGKVIDLTPPWPRLPMMEAIRRASGLDWQGMPDAATARADAAKLGLDVPPEATASMIFDAVWSSLVEPELVGPVFITDYPVEISPLAKRRADNPRLVYRFEAFICGFEACNAFSELNDPHDQRSRFEQQAAEKAKGNDEAHVYDEDFVTALEYGMPPTGGLGIGVDRMVMLLTGAASLRDVILFPVMKPR
jgi:lysyl-tRNA synthetase class 2